MIYRCARDGSELERTAGAGSVLRCPACGYRTDTPGDGVLGDAFDVTHRQWGLRGDVHAWNAMRDLLATRSTPETGAEVRAAFVDALRHVAAVDVDDPDGERQPYRADLDHGGMSGGMVDVGWWREQGIPLLVERALARRPASAAAAAAMEPPRPPTAVRRPMRGVITGALVWAVILAIPAALLGGGGWLLYQRAHGTAVRATVIDCDTSGGIVRGASTIRTDCTARWTIDGRTVVGGFTGGNGDADVGKTVDATVRGDTAYSRSLGLPIVLIALGLPFLLPPAFALRSRMRRR